MNRSKLFVYNSLSAAFLQIATIIAGFIIPRIMLTVYGSEINGLVTSITQFIAYFNLIEAGLASACVYALYKPLAEKDNSKINAILSAARAFYNKAGYIFISMVLGLSLIYPAFIRSSSLGIMEVGFLVLIIGISGALEFLTMSKYRVLLTADQRIYVLSYASLVAIILNTLIIAVLSHFNVNIVIVRLVAVSAVFLRSLILWIYVRKNYKDLDIYAPPDSHALNKRWDAFYLQILGSVHSGVPIIIATLFTSLTVVSVYSVFNIVLGGISGLLSITINGLYSSFGNLLALNKKAVFQQAYQEFELSYYMFITWVYACSYILIMPFIRLYTAGVTDAHYDLPLIGALFVINGLLNNIKTPQGTLIFSAGLFKESRYQTMTQGIIAIALSLIFVQFWGLAGILLGAITSNIYRDIDLMFFIPKHVTNLPVRFTFYRIIRVVLTFTIAVLPTYLIVLPISNYFDWAKWAVLVGLYVLCMVLLINFLFDRSIFMAVLSRFWRVLNSGKRHPASL